VCVCGAMLISFFANASLNVTSHNTARERWGKLLRRICGGTYSGSAAAGSSKDTSSGKKSGPLAGSDFGRTSGPLGEGSISVYQVRV